MYAAIYINALYYGNFTKRIYKKTADYDEI